MESKKYIFLKFGFTQMQNIGNAYYSALTHKIEIRHRNSHEITGPSRFDRKYKNRNMIFPYEGSLFE